MSGSGRGLGRGAAAGMRALVRVEWRQLTRHRGRSLLVVALVAVAVAAVVGASTLLHVTERTPEEACAQVLGRARLAVRVRGDEEAERVRGVLPAGVVTGEVRRGIGEVTVPGRRLVARFLSGEFDGIAGGIVRKVGGEWPGDEGEVALSPVLVAGLGVEVGGRVRLGGEREVRVTGTVVDPEALSAPVVVLGGRVERARERVVLVGELERERESESESGSEGESESEEESESAARRGRQHELETEWAAALTAAGFDVTTRAQLSVADPFQTAVIFVLGGFGMVEAGLVIAAAFAVSLRRRQREIGLLGSCGASRGGVRVSLLLSAAGLAGVGGVLGIGIGAGAAAVVHPRLDGWNDRWNGAFEVVPAHWALALVLGVVAAVSAVALPARGATRLPIRVALSGRRPVRGSSAGWMVLGVACLALCVVLAAQPAEESVAGGVRVLASSVLGVVGLGALSPWLLHRLARLAGPLPVAWRLAVRDAGRFRARNGPVVTAVLAGMALSVALAALVGSIEDWVGGRRPVLRQDHLLVEGAEAEKVAGEVARELGGKGAAALDALYGEDAALTGRYSLDGEPRQDWVAAGTPALLEIFDVAHLAPELERGRLLALDLDQDVDEVTLLGAEGERVIARADFVHARTSEPVRGPRFLLARGRAEELGLGVGPPPGRALAPWIVRLPEAVTSARLERAQQLAAAASATSVQAALQELRPARAFYRALRLLTVLTGLVILVVATALTSVESAADAEVLRTVGAPPGLLARHVGARAAYLALLGCALAVPAGLVPARGLVGTTDLEFTIPWVELLLAVFTLPAAAYFVTAGYTALTAWRKR